MKDLGEPGQLLGLNISRDQRTKEKIWLDQTSHINKIFKKYVMEDCKATLTSYDLSNKLNRDMMPQNEEENGEDERSIVSRSSGEFAVY